VRLLAAPASPASPGTTGTASCRVRGWRQYLERYFAAPKSVVAVVAAYAGWGGRKPCGCMLTSLGC
jgi:hypothetical protein